MSKDEGWEIGGIYAKILVCTFAVIVPLGFYARGAGWLSERTFAPLEEQVRHDTFKQSQAYTDGMAQDLNAMWLEYANFKTDKEQKAAIRSVALHRVANFPVETLPPYLRKWINELRSQ